MNFSAKNPPHRKPYNRWQQLKATFDNFSPSHQREYFEWIIEAKTEETRNKRMETAVEWLNEGKSRNWKYQKKINLKKNPARIL